MQVQAEQSFQAEPGGWVVSCAKGDPRLQCDVDSGWILWLTPGGNYPQPLIDLGRLIAVPDAFKPLLILYVLYLQDVPHHD